MLNIERIERWIQDLESDKFEQGKNVLRNTDNGYCCLGVLGNQYVEDGLAEWRQDAGGAFRLEPKDSHSERTILPESMRNDMGLDSWGGARYFTYRLRDRYGSIGEYSVLSAANDSGIPFASIAQGLRDLLAVERAMEESYAE